MLITAATPAGDAKRILSETGFTGGLIVHLGCGDGKLTAALGTGEGRLVHGLDAKSEHVRAARRHIRDRGLCGTVSVDLLEGGRLPYAENLVTLLVADDPGTINKDEIMRVLAPGGTAVIGGSKTVKARPDGIDDWTHPLHGPGGNPVAGDRVVGPPRRLAWKAGPRWARSHGWTPSVTAMVSTGGRFFYICDVTPAGMNEAVPSKWFLFGRDAFNGVLLWKRRIPRWGSAQFSGTPDSGGAGVTGRFTMPPNAAKRLAAVGDTVYVTLEPDAPVSAIDAATGKTKQVYENTKRADELVVVDGRLVVSINPPEKPADRKPQKQVCAVDAKTGALLWREGPFTGVRTTKIQDPFGRLELAAGNGKVFFLTAEHVVCLALETGKTAWNIDRPPLPKAAVTKLGFSGMYEYNLTTMLYADGSVLLAQPEPNTHHTYHTMPGGLYAFNAENGEQMWKHGYGGWGHQTQPDVFVVDGTVWSHVHVETAYGHCWGGGLRAKNPAQVDYRIQGIDLKTGSVKKELPTKLIFNVGHHHRCARNKITSRFLMSARRGVEFVDLSSGENYQHHWTRSGCLVGYLPCNGLLYVTPHPCDCYITAKLTGFNALAPAAASDAKPIPADARLVTGPAYGKTTGGDIHAAQDDWPTYRHDGLRSGATASAVGGTLSVRWKSRVGNAPTAPVVAGGRVYAAAADEHVLCVFDATTGDSAWQFTAGGRIDAPPTIHEGAAIFGSADGRVYCLRAADGALAWRFDAAPRRRLVADCGRLESAWPVPGSVLIREGKCYCAAGRSSYLDGGVRFYVLDPDTGAVLEERTICSRDPETGKMKPTSSARSMEGLLNDIPATDGKNVYIRQMKVASGGGTAGVHLYSSGGYLDSSWFNRIFRQAGRARTRGLMVLGSEAAYGVEVYPGRGRDTLFKPGSQSYRLMCLSLKARPNAKDKRRKRRGPKPLWQQKLGIRVTAMVRAGKRIFVAGARDVVDPDDPHGAWEGRKNGVLAVCSTDDGEKLSESELLPAPPAWDGMAAAGGHLYISLVDGEVVCLAGKD